MQEFHNQIDHVQRLGVGQPPSQETIQYFKCILIDNYPLKRYNITIQNEVYKTHWVALSTKGSQLKLMCNYANNNPEENKNLIFLIKMLINYID